MKILIIGASGFIGSRLYNNLSEYYECYGTFSYNEKENLVHLDLGNINEIKEIIDKIRPSVVINTSAISDVDYCELNKEEAYKINVRNLKNLIDHLDNSKLVHFSSDYVFGEISKVYVEEDERCPVNYYGDTKAIAEDLVLKGYSNYLIIRVAIVYGLGRGFYNFVRDNLKRNREINVFIDQIGNPTFVDDIPIALLKLLDKNGIYHVAGPEALSRYELAKRVAKFFELDEKLNLLNPATLDTFRMPAKRPKNTSLSIKKIESLGVRMSSIEEGLESV